MQVAVCMVSAHSPVYEQKMKWFAEGVSDHCDIVDWENLPAYHQNYVPVIYGSVKHKRGAAHHRIKSQIDKYARPYVMLETPLVHRRADTIDHAWLRVGVNGFLWDHAMWGFDHMDPKRTIVDPIKWRDNGSHILILMQNPGDASLRGADIFEWCDNTVKQLRTHTDRPIKIRPHPLPTKRAKLKDLEHSLTKIKNVEFVENILPNIRPLELDLKDCWCAVSYTSGSAVDAVLAGVPNISCDPGNMTWPISSHSINMIEIPYTGPTQQWEQQISHCQFSVEELRNGVCWNHIKQTLGKIHDLKTSQ